MSISHNVTKGLPSGVVRGFLDDANNKPWRLTKLGVINCQLFANSIKELRDMTITWGILPDWMQNWMYWKIFLLSSWWIKEFLTPFPPKKPWKSLISQSHMALGDQGFSWVLEGGQKSHQSYSSQHLPNNSTQPSNPKDTIDNRPLSKRTGQHTDPLDQLTSNCDETNIHCFRCSQGTWSNQLRWWRNRHSTISDSFSWPLLE